MDQNDITKQYKLVLLGDTAVGKSTFLYQLLEKRFKEVTEPTLGSSFQTYILSVNSEQIMFEIWDTAGQEKYKAVAPIYYRTAKACIFMYNVTELDSFWKATQWIEQVKENGSKNCVFCLVGNKIDLDHEEHPEIEEYVQKEDILHIKTSSKTGENVEKTFHLIGEMLLKQNYPKENTKMPLNNKNKKCC